MASHKIAIDANIAEGKKEHGTAWTKANRKKWATADVNNILNKLPAVAEQLIDAIDTENETGFKNVCTGTGLSPELALRVWDATMGSIDPQSVKPCW